MDKHDEINTNIKHLQRLYFILPLIIWAVGYVFVMIVAGEIDFRKWNVFGRTFYGFYFIGSFYIIWLAISNGISGYKKAMNKKQEEVKQ